MSLMSLVNIFRNKSRSLLTMIGIGVGVFSVVLISTIGSSGTVQVNQTLVNMGIDSLLIQSAITGDKYRLFHEDIEKIQDIKGVEESMPILSSMNESIVIGEKIPTYTWGIDGKAKNIISLNAKYGRLINASDTATKANVVVIDESIALKTYGRSNVVGKTMKILLGGTFHQFEIIGVAESGISSLQTMLSNIVPEFLYIPYTTMQDKVDKMGFDKIAVKLSSDADDKLAIDTIKERINSAYNSEIFTVNSLIQQRNQLDNIMETVTLALSAIAGISLFVSGLSVMTTMLATVSERKREIGIKKSIGAKTMDILAEFIGESILLSLIGSLGGVVSGIGVSYLGGLILGIDIFIHHQIIATSIGISVIIGLIFGAYPAYKAAKLSPVEAFR